MKAAFTLLAFVASAVAGNVARHGKEEHHGPDKGYPVVVTYGAPTLVLATRTLDVTFVCLREQVVDALKYRTNSHGRPRCAR